MNPSQHPLLVMFDWETTSDKPDTTRGVQFAALGVRDESVQFKMEGLCDPEVSIHPNATEVHGITNDHVRGLEKDYEVAVRFAEHLDAGSITAGHNSLAFDLPVTRRLARMGGSSEVFNQAHIDTMVLSQRVWPKAPSFRLSATEEEARTPGAIGLTQWLGLGEGEGAHDAMADVLMVHALIKRLQADTGKTLEGLAQWQLQPFIHSHCHFGKYRGYPWGPNGVPRHYVQWCCNHWEKASIDMQATILYHYGLSFRFKGAMK